MQFFDRCKDLKVPEGVSTTPDSESSTTTQGAQSDDSSQITTPLPTHCLQAHTKCKEKCSFRKYCRKINYTKAYCHGAYTNAKKSASLQRRARNSILNEEFGSFKQ